MTNNLFRWSIGYTLSKMKECLKSYTSNDTEVLRSRMVFFTITTAVAYSFLNPNLFSLVWQ